VAQPHSRLAETKIKQQTEMVRFGFIYCSLTIGIRQTVQNSMRNRLFFPFVTITLSKQTGLLFSRIFTEKGFTGYRNQSNLHSPYRKDSLPKTVQPLAEK
jgi:hypothetical protein